MTQEECEKSRFNHLSVEEREYLEKMFGDSLYVKHKIWGWMIDDLMIMEALHDVIWKHLHNTVKIKT